MADRVLHTSESGEPSRLFGEKFPYVLDGKLLLLEVCREFAAEYIDAARRHANKNLKLPITSAYPTSKSECPRIAVIRNQSTPGIAGLGGDIDLIETEAGQWKRIKANVVNEVIEVSLCTINEWERDDIYLWFQQYMLDAIEWLLPQLRNVTSVICTSAMDDIVEYQGVSSQAGFQFYLARQMYAVRYDQIVAKDVDTIAGFINWQRLCDGTD